MHNKTKKKIFITTISSILLLCCFSKLVFATGLEDPTSIVTGPDMTGVGTLFNLGNVILGIIQYVSIVVSSIADIVLGIKYMYSSPEDKAEIKKKLVPFIIGGILVFGAVQLVKLVEIFVGEII